MAPGSQTFQRIATRLTAAEAFGLLRRGAGDMFLDSGMDLGEFARRSFLLFSSGISLTAHGSWVVMTRAGRPVGTYGDPFTWVRKLLGEFRTIPLDDPFAPLCGAVAGYFGYDLRRFVEEVPVTLSDDVGLPDLWLQVCPVVVTFDRRESTCWVGWTDCGLGWEHALATDIIDTLRTAPPPRTLPDRHARLSPTVTSNFAPEEYRRAVDRVREYILAGDIYQVNLAQRFTVPARLEAWDVYRRLRRINPAPFAAYLDGGRFQVLSASPERFLWLDPRSRRMHTRPIKGTRPRGAGATSDRNLAHALLRSEKDNAEHLMIVDLERNDLGRVAEVGSVCVSSLAELETFPTVFHLTSTIEATLRSDCDRVDLLRATFPGGSITGAPKIRAMEIIEELEPVRRGVYTGALGYLGFDGSLDLNIVIRTLVVKDRNVWFHAGGGIVADSDPEEEYQETLDKARALVEALAAPSP